MIRIRPLLVVLHSDVAPSMLANSGTASDGTIQQIGLMPGDRAGRAGRNDSLDGPDYHRMARVSEDREVESDRPVVNVEEIEALVGAEGRVVASLALPETGDSGAHLIPTPELGIKVDVLVREGEPRPDQAHRPGEYVPELRQLVDARRPQNATDPGYPGIVRGFEERAPRPLVHRLQVGEHLGGLGHHGAELQDSDWLAVLTDDRVAVQDRTAVFQLDTEAATRRTGTTTGATAAVSTMSMARLVISAMRAPGVARRRTRAYPRREQPQSPARQAHEARPDLDVEAGGEAALDGRRAALARSAPATTMTLSAPVHLASPGKHRRERLGHFAQRFASPARRRRPRRYSRAPAHR